MSGVSKIVAERNQKILLELVSQPGNDTCADCKSRAPRWASHNLGIFLCVRCASIHRKIGTHVTKVKSLTLDSWSKEQVENMKSIGNVKANSYWNPDERKNPPPANMEESERDSDLEKYIRSKYEFKRFRSLSARAAEHLGESRSLASLQLRPRTAPIRSGTSPAPTPSEAAGRTPPLPERSTNSYNASPSVPSLGPTGSNPRSISAMATSPPVTRSVSLGTGFNPPTGPGFGTGAGSTQMQQAQATKPTQQTSLTNSTFSDLISLQAGSSTDSSLPLQYTSTPTPTQFQNQNLQFQQTPSPFSTGTTPNPYATLSLTTGSVSTSPNAFRSASMPVYGAGASGGIMTQPTGFNANPGGGPMNTGLGLRVPNPFTQQQLNAGMAGQGQSPSPFMPSSMSPPPMGGMGTNMTMGMGSPFPQFTGTSQLSAQTQMQTPQFTGATMSMPSMSPMAMSPPSMSPMPMSMSSPLATSSQIPSGYNMGYGNPGMPPPSGPPASAPSPLSHQAQQAQELFRSMTSPQGGGNNSNNPFGGQWGR